MNKKQVYNPYLPSYEYVPDGEPHVFGNRIYLFGSHDRFNGKKYCENDYVCWSAPVYDLSSWRYDGVISKKVQDLGNRKGIAGLKIRKTYISWADAGSHWKTAAVFPVPGNRK